MKGTFCSLKAEVYIRLPISWSTWAREKHVRCVDYFCLIFTFALSVGFGSLMPDPAVGANSLRNVSQSQSNDVKFWPSIKCLDILWYFGPGFLMFRNTLILAQGIIFGRLFHELFVPRDNTEELGMIFASILVLGPDVYQLMKSILL